MRKTLTYLLIALLTFSLIFGMSGCDKKKTEKLICGVTIYEPMNYLDENEKWTGFDTEFALLVGEKLGMEVEFQRIEWANKYSELQAGTINCIWNGFTANTTEEDGRKRSEYVDFSYSYMLNQQCIVIKSDDADKFNDTEDMKGKKIAVEKGSAGETAANELIGKIIEASSQINTLLEVKSGAADCAIVDILLAQSLVGKGNYTDLKIADNIPLESEVYAIGFKKGSPLVEKVNEAMVELYEEGKLQEIAKKYGLENNLHIDTDFKG